MIKNNLIKLLTVVSLYFVSYVTGGLFTSSYEEGLRIVFSVSLTFISYYFFFKNRI